MRISDWSSDVCSSDLNGRIVADDIRDAEPPVLQVSAAATSSLAAGAKLDQVKALYADTPFAEVELDGMRRTIARRLVESKQQVPPFYLSTALEIQRALQPRQRGTDSG